MAISALYMQNLSPSGIFPISSDFCFYFLAKLKRNWIIFTINIITADKAISGYSSLQKTEWNDGRIQLTLSRNWPMWFNASSPLHLKL